MLFLSCFVYFHARLLVGALWSPAGKGLTSWLSFVMSSCDVVTFPLVSLVRCGAWLYRFLIFVLFLTFVGTHAETLWVLYSFLRSLSYIGKPFLVVSSLSCDEFWIQYKDSLVVWNTWNSLKLVDESGVTCKKSSLLYVLFYILIYMF